MRVLSGLPVRKIMRRDKEGRRKGEEGERTEKERKAKGREKERRTEKEERGKTEGTSSTRVAS